MKLITTSKAGATRKLGDQLAEFLADTYTLYLKTQNFHWNVTGPNFHSLHTMFEEQYTELALAVDEIAERIRALQCHAPASFSQFLKLTSIKEETGHPSAKDMVKQLAKDNEAVARYGNEILATSQKAQDEATTDMLISRIRAHEKAAWMLRSTLE